MATIAATPSAARRRRRLWQRPIQLREAIDGYVFILPWILGLGFFTLGPFVAGLLFSLADFDVLTPPRFVGIENYRAILLQDPKFRLAIYNTAWYVGLSVLPGVALGLLLALLLNQKVRGIAVFRTLFYMPAIVPAIAGAVLWGWVLIPDPSKGLVNSVWAQTLTPWLGAEVPGWFGAADWSKPALVMMGLWGAGGGMILWLAGLKGIPSTLYEAASIDGAGPWRSFWASIWRSLKRNTPEGLKGDRAWLRFTTGIASFSKAGPDAAWCTKRGPASAAPGPFGARIWNLPKLGNPFAERVPVAATDP